MTFPSLPCSPHAVIEIRVGVCSIKREIRVIGSSMRNCLLPLFWFLNEAAWQLPSQNTFKY